jgi:casein kinase 1
MFIHLLTPGGLSWTRNGVPKNNAQHDRIIREKRNTRPEDLCKGIPPEFEEFLRYCRRLKFAECPNYARWKEEFKELAIAEGFPGTDEFIWPPPPISHVSSQLIHEDVYRLTLVMQLKPHSTHTAALRRTPAPAGAENVEQILNDLANLKLDDRPVLGDRMNINNAVQQAKMDAKKPAAAFIVISDDTDGGKVKNHAPSPVVARMPKAAQLNKLTSAVNAASDNNAIAQVVLDFVVFLQSNRSRTLTKEGFGFLDALYKQLADPSVFILPLRTSRTRNSDKEQQMEPPEARHVKLDVLAALRREVAGASGNQALAKMVADFGAVTNRSSGRTVTKDGFAFLEGLAARLKSAG